jgi:asparagine synthase (glutamine-hydrolysing)
LCGIAGFVTPNPFNKDQAASILQAMTDSLVHRGPDASGHWIDSNALVALGHRRLSILDLSDAGSQPMSSKCGRFVVTFNGEIYNHLTLRKELEKKISINWNGTSDTETLIEAISYWGLENTLTKLKGMFAFAIWDKKFKILSLARDPIGEKHLYYGWQGDTLIFGSELKAFKKHPDFQQKISKNSLALFLLHNYVPAPYSIFQGINKLLPGHYVSINLEKYSAALKSVPYWSISNIPKEDNVQFCNESIVINELEKKLNHSVQSQMLSDVPIGSLLSGGIDSTLITAIMQKNSTKPIKTFTIGFEDKTFNEAGYAASIAEYLKTDHHELYVSSEDSLSLIPDLAKYWDEPFADSSQIPTYLVMQLASNKIKVALSGDGADELFGGYNRYKYAPKIWNQFGWMPSNFKKTLKAILTMISASKIDTASTPFSKILGISHLGQKIHKLGNRFSHLNSIDSFYYSLVTEWLNVNELLREPQYPSYLLNDFESWPKFQNPVSRMMAIDTLTYLPDDILTKVDRASMAVSIESRAPFLDLDVIEYAFNLPLNFKIKNNQSKWILRQILNKSVPERLINRPKMGFGLPIDEWLRGPLKEWADDLLNQDKLHQQGYFNAEYVQNVWNKHCNGEQFGSRLWGILMFQNWLEQQ